MLNENYKFNGRHNHKFAYYGTLSIAYFNLAILRVCAISDAVVLEITEELDAKNAVKRHEEEEENRHIVYLLA